MKANNRPRSQILLILLLGLSIAHSGASTEEQSGNDFQLQSAVLASGGSAAAGGEFELNGTLGQPAAEQSSGDDFTLHSGFWPTVKPNDDIIFRNSFE
jgi:hypothetical protein